jgi:HK97 family phage major capsid protein
MSSVQELQLQHDTAFAAADNIVSTAERQKRQLTLTEQKTVDVRLAEAVSLRSKIAEAKSNSASRKTPAEIRAQLASVPRERINRNGDLSMPDKFSRGYLETWRGYVSGSGPLSASLEEGVSGAGGYAIPIVVNEQVVPLAPQDSAIRSLATVIKTKSDIQNPTVTMRGAISSKTEAASFTTGGPGLGQFTLSAFTAGLQVQASFEIVQDVPQFDAFVLADVVSAFLEYEEALFISGTGSGQPQGLIGNVGAGGTYEPDGLGNVVSIAATWGVISTLKAAYAKNASWLMSRATALGIRAAQVGTDLFEPVFRRENGVDLLHGFPVAYSSQMPAAARGATPVLFGDFAKGYLIGDRGGSALIVKVMDQTSALQGLVDFFFYRRTDGRVRRAEAIQALTISAS